VIVEAVNLALRTAEKDADALTSRLQRIQEGETERQIRFVLGYIASPGGLNGEPAMKEWLEHKTGTHAYDLDREAGAFHFSASDAVADLDDPLGLGWHRDAEPSPSATRA
jgi:hypothetical protein